MRNGGGSMTTEEEEKTAINKRRRKEKGGNWLDQRLFFSCLDNLASGMQFSSESSSLLRYYD